METKKIIVAFLLLSVFTVGTLSFADTVEAATWKKFDSGKFKNKNPGQKLEKTASYISYEKGTKEIKVELYAHSKDNKKTKFSTVFISKTGNKIKAYTVNIKGKKSKQSSITYTGNAKKFYNQYISHLKTKGV